MNEQMKNELKKFKAAAMEITKLWNELPSDEFNDLADEYPFDECFEEIVEKINNWVDHQTE